MFINLNAYCMTRLCSFIFFVFLCPFESCSNPRFDQEVNKFKTWIWKSKHVSFLVTPKWSSWEGFWNFHVWNQKPLLFMHVWLHKTEFRVRGRYMIFLVWICVDLVYQLNWMLTIWHKKTLVFKFFFEFLCPFESWSNPRFDQDLNKFKSWIWKIKHLSFLVTPKLLGGFLKFPCLKPKTTSLHACLTS